MINALEFPYETEVIEFKEARSSFSFKEAGRYFSALSNEALLRGRSDAWLIFGMADGKAPCGTHYRSDRKSLQSLKRELAARTNNRITFREIHELEIDGLRVLAFQIPSATPGMPTAFDNAAWSREGESLAPLPIDKYEEIRQMRRHDWSAEVVEEASSDDLDPNAVSRVIDLFRAKHRSHGDAFATMS